MKRLLVIAALTTLAAATSSAQNVKQTNKKSTKTSTSTVTLPTASSTTTSPVAAPAPNQSTTTLPQAAAAPSNAFSMSLMSQVVASANELHYGTGKTTFNTVNYLGGSYKFDKETRLSLRQYFGYDRVPNNPTNKVVTMDPTLILGKTLGTLWNSDPVSASFWYYIPASNAARDVRSNGSLRADVVMNWTLTPKWSVGYYFNPRQALTPTRWVENKDEATKAEKPLNEVAAKTRLYHAATFGYNFNDTVGAYLNAGLLHGWRTRDLVQADESVETALGSTVSLGKVMLVAEVDHSYALKSNFAGAKRKAIFDDGNLSYVVQGAVTF